MVKAGGEKKIFNRVHSSCLLAICVFMFIVTGCARLKTLPENIVEMKEKQDEAEGSEKPENTVKESAAKREVRVYRKRRGGSHFLPVRSGGFFQRGSGLFFLRGRIRADRP